ncbi:FAD-dependent oxidoreductase [Candidatus Parvarchaeota archaeon]|nr:FAD-dependent oxidoreductase [Candidatus Parvarchaeota archaeon]
MSKTKIAVIGAGAIGSAIAHDLSSRGFKVSVVEKGNIIGGTSGRFHGLLHSGARYAANDIKTARESVQDNKVISRIAGHCVEDTGGLFISLEGEDDSYKEAFLKGCAKAGIECRPVDIESLKQEEPFISKSVKSAFLVPDKVINSFRYIASLLLTAKSEGADVLFDTEVIDFKTAGKNVTGIRTRNVRTGKTADLKADLVINASGAWSSRLLFKSLNIRSMKTILSAGTMIVFDSRFTRYVLNRLRPPSDGDIIVPFFGQSIVGTTSFLVNSPDKVRIDKDDIEFLKNEGSKLIPVIKNMPVHRSYSGVRALVAQAGSDPTGRETSRDFMIFDHSKLDDMAGLLSIGGGKLSTSRLIAKDVGDHVCHIFGSKERSKTNRIQLEWPKLTNDNLSKIAEKTGLSDGFLREVLEETSSRTFSDMYSPAMDLIISRLLFD